MRLDPAAAATGFRLAAHDTLGSTNAEALETARRGERGPLWITARTQTAGRGRRGSAWISVPGNLFATLLLCDPAPPRQAPQLSLVAGLAVHDAILDQSHPLREKIALKWPNDLVCDGAKLAGILIEAESVASPGEPRMALAVGIGVNCARHPVLAPAQRATDLASLGAKVTAEALFLALSRTMMQRLAQWQRGAGFPAIRSDWLARATGIGGEMRVRLPGRELHGRGETLDDDGRLLLRLPDGSLQPVSAGEVFSFADAEAARAAEIGSAG